MVLGRFGFMPHQGDNKSKVNPWIARSLILFIVFDLPQWFQACFLSEPLVPWLERKGLTMHFSPFWITGSITILLVCIFGWIDWKHRRFQKIKTEPQLEFDSDLEIEGVPIDIKTAQYHQCQIRIHNKNSSKTADNVRVELLVIEDAGISPADDYFRPKLPIILKPEIAGENSINPGGSQKYNLFRISTNVKSAILKNGVAIGWQQKFLAYFTQETTKDVIQFVWKEFYRLKLVVTARDFLKSEAEFFLSFSDEGEFCRFNLTKTKTIETQQDDRIARKKIKDSLAGCRMTIQNLCAQLEGIQYFRYYGETRQNFERDYLNFENSTYQFLNDKVGRSEAISFIDDQRIPKINAPPDSSFDLPAFRDRWIAKNFMLNRLKFRDEQIEKAETKLDSKDFVLPIESPNKL